MVTRGILVASAFAALSGCSSLHPTVKTPVDTSTGQPVSWAVDTAQAVALTRQHADFYQTEVSTLVEKQRNLDDAIVASATGGVLGGIARDIRAMVFFGAIAGTSSVLDQRYRIAMQADIYRKAYKATDCLNMKVVGLEKLQGNEASIPDSILEVKAFGIPSAVNEQLRLVRSRLRDQLDGMVLLRPDDNALRTAFLAATQAAQGITSAAGNPAIKSPTGIGAGAPAPLAGGLNAAQFKQLWLRLVTLDADLQKCVAEN